jgi:hypothetical protein
MTSILSELGFGKDFPREMREWQGGIIGKYACALFCNTRSRLKWPFSVKDQMRTDLRQTPCETASLLTAWCVMTTAEKF